MPRPAVGDVLLALIGCRRGAGPPPETGRLHDARTDWRPGCSHCWLFAGIGLLLWGLTVAGMVALLNS